jgi:hypothetical protein
MSTLSPSALVTLRRAFVDVCRGYSIGRLGELGANGTGPNSIFYIKHLGHEDHLELDIKEDQYVQLARSQGVKTEKERLDFLISRGLWSAQQEAEIVRTKDLISRMEEGRKSITAPQMVKAHEADLAKEKAKLSQLSTQRAEAIGMTAESYATKQIYDEYVLANLFIDKELSSPLYSYESLDDLSDLEIESVILAYEHSTAPCSDANLRRLALQDFFQQYWRLAEAADSFYGKTISKLSYYQVRLALFAKRYRSLLDSIDTSTLAPETLSDPDALDRYVSTKARTDEALAKGQAPVGMSAKDIKEMGLEGKIGKAPNKEMNAIEMVNFLKGGGRL